MSYIWKSIKYTIIQPENVINIIFKQVDPTDSFSNVSARIWNLITTNFDVNILFMQFKIVLKLYLHEMEVILK